MVRLRISTPRPWELERTDPRFLDAIDAAVRWTDWRFRNVDDHDSPDDLEQILRAGGSGWRVSDNFQGLERRVDETATAAITHTIKTTSGASADHLRKAWESAYGRDPNADTAYREAVLAVEALACPLVSPANARATLGTVIADLRNQGAKWELSLTGNTGGPAGIDGLLAMLQLLWQGQSRHAGSPNSRRQTQAEAEASVHLAATLVQWLSAGVLRRV